MYLKLTLVPLIKKKFKFGIFLFVNSFLISVPLKKKCFLNAYFYFTFIIKIQNDISFTLAVIFMYLSSRVIEDLLFQFEALIQDYADCQLLKFKNGRVARHLF